MGILEEIRDHINMNRLDRALELVLENEKAFSSNPDFLNMEAVLSLKAGEYDVAVNCLESALSIDNSNTDYNYNLAYAYEMTGDHEKALDFYKIAYDLTEDEEFKESIKKDITRLEDNYSSGYCEVIVNDTHKKVAPEVTDQIHTNRRNGVKLFIDDDRPLISIMVIAYNNLEKYTKQCVECILKYTRGIDYELVLVDNGSSDGTFEYFKSVPHRKKKIVRITENKGAAYGGLSGMQHMCGQYIVCIPNDVYVTRNWLSNMLKCAESDERIGFIAPASDNISNFQSANITFESMEEMQEKAAAYNVSDPRKWEERLRLINAVSFFRKECLDVIGKTDYGFYHDFGDDDYSFRVRRAGFKAIFCRDVFVHHVGSITAGLDTKEKLKMIETGREVFRKKYFGIDAWDDVNNFENTMLSMVNAEEKRDCSDCRILGIDVRCGTPILQLKNRLRSADIFNATLSAFVEDARYWLDLKTICEGDVRVDRVEHFHEHYSKCKFDYIILGEALNTYTDAYKLLKHMLNTLKSGGHLLLKVRNNYDVRAFLNTLNKPGYVDRDIKSHIDINLLVEFLVGNGYNVKYVIPEFHQTDENSKDLILNALKNLSLVDNINSVFEKMFVRDFVIDIVNKE